MGLEGEAGARFRSSLGRRLPDGVGLGLFSATRAMAADPVRTGASVASVAAGVAVVVCLVSVVRGGRREAMRAVEAAGPTNVFLEAPAGAGGALLSTADVGRLASAVPGVVAACGLRARPGEAKAGERRSGAQVVGVDAGFFRCFPARARLGRLLGDAEEEGRPARAVLGAALAARLFPSGNPVGRTVELGGAPFDVVGVLGAVPSDAGSGGRAVRVDWGDAAFVPLGSEPGASLASPSDYPVDTGVLRFSSLAESARAARALPRLVRGGVEVRTPQQALAQRRATTRTFDRIAAVVSLLTILSAAFGVSNLLRASVHARSAEIGLRRAVGARRQDIRMQFLGEGLLVGLRGGLLGIVAGWVIARLVVANAGWAADFDLAWLGLAVAGSVAFGIGVGIGPAAEAARLQPADTLRNA